MIDLTIHHGTPSNSLQFANLDKIEDNSLGIVSVHSYVALTFVYLLNK
jgi:hypothetical protein